MKVLLVTNYAQDQQFSMRAFAQMLEQGLPSFGCETKVVSPKVIFGKGRNTVTGIGKWLGYIDKYLIARKQLSQAEQSFRPDIVHICDHSNAMYRPLFRAPTVINCHDLLAVRTWLGEIPGESKTRIGGLQQKWIFHHLPRANSIACISAKTRDDLVRLAPDTKHRAHVIPMGLNYAYHPITTSEADQRIANAGGIKSLTASPMQIPWALHVGNNSWYKNRLGAIRIWKEVADALGQHFGLVLVGDSLSEAQRELIKGHEEYVATLQNVSNELLEALYCKARCLLFPSLAEGFGWPPIEAQACGCPVITSNIEPLKSNCHGALLIDPNDEAAAAKAAAAWLMDSAQQESARKDGLKNARKFTPEKMVESYAQLYQQTLNQA